MQTPSPKAKRTAPIKTYPVIVLSLFSVFEVPVIESVGFTHTNLQTVLYLRAIYTLLHTFSQFPFFRPHFSSSDKGFTRIGDDDDVVVVVVIVVVPSFLLSYISYLVVVLLV